tara:strand:+ start:4472 stop:4696 length:225 start_codon:yes stop_codon:yes gene_type:complete
MKAEDLKVGDLVACIDTDKILGPVTRVRLVNEEDTRDLRVTAKGEEHWGHDLRLMTSDEYSEMCEMAYNKADIE